MLLDRAAAHHASRLMLCTSTLRRCSRRLHVASASITRETAPPDPTAKLSEFHLDRLQMTQEEYQAAVALQLAARKEYLEASRRPGIGGLERHNLEARYHIRYGKCFLKCPTCWLQRGLCVCSRLRKMSANHEIALFMHHNEHGRSSNTGCLLRAALGSKMYVRRAAGSGSGRGDHTPSSYGSQSR